MVMTNTPWYKYCYFLVLIYSEYEEVSTFTTSQLLFQDSTTSASTIPTTVTVTTVIKMSTNMVITLTATSEYNTISKPTSVVSRPTADISVVGQPTVDATTGNSWFCACFYIMIPKAYYNDILLSIMMIVHSWHLCVHVLCM